jgi:uncharacterized protein
MSIPQKIRISTAVSRREHYVGELQLDSLPRLAETLTERGDAVQVDLLACQIAGHASLTGVIEGPLHLECRRCGKPYLLALRHELDLRLVASEEEEQRLLSDCDPYRVQGDELPLRELLEDELLLALPMLPRCNSCENVANAVPGPVQTEEPRRENPFAALKKLKR